MNMASNKTINLQYRTTVLSMTRCSRDHEGVSRVEATRRILIGRRESKFPNLSKNRTVDWR